MNETSECTVAIEDIESLIAMRKKTYLDDPRLILENYNNERKNIDEYNGRQLLEMIQNANDECDTYKSKKVLIKLEENTLIIANNGNPFSKGGVESLMYSDFSPKVMEENKVGQKGLGFRSVLNWSKEIYIASYDLNIKFSKNHAESFLKELIGEDPRIHDLLLKKTKEKFPISVLRCPYIEKDISLKREPEYDTVIELSLKDDVHTDILTQINKDIIPEILIFLHKLEEIEVQTPEHHFLLKKEQEDGRVIISLIDYINEDQNQEWIWYLIEDKGILDSGDEIKNYELKIAYNPSIKNVSQKLFSYFRTDIDFPYPVLAHGSFELSASRNQLVNDEHRFNIQLINKLAELLVRCSLKLATNDQCNYDALKLVIPTSAQYSSLNAEPWNFKKSIEEYIQHVAIFPTVTNQYIRLIDSPRFYSKLIEPLIPDSQKDDFSTLLKSSGDPLILDFFAKRSLGLKYDDDEFTNKINNIISSETLLENNTVEWIYLLCEHTSSFYKDKKPTLPNLLVSFEDKLINTNDEIILPPEDETYKLPKDIRLQFIQKKQFDKLKLRFGNVGIRKMVDKLSLYSVIEYAMNVVVQKIVTATHKILIDDSTKKEELISEMHSALFRIYSNLSDKTGSKVSYPSSLTSPYLISREGNLKPADQLYFGEEYGKVGQLMEGLLCSLYKDVFIGDINKIRLDLIITEEDKIRNNTLLVNYLKWLGVADLPRKKKLELKAHAFKREPFINSIISGLNYPYFMYNTSEIISSLDEMSEYWEFKCEVLFYEYFDEIIKASQIEYILTWFVKDKDILNSISTNHEPSSHKLTFRCPYKRNLRSINDSDLSSYISHKLQSQAFIPVEDGTKVCPANCLLDGISIGSLISTPKINYQDQLFKDNYIDKVEINYLLRRLGVKDSLKDLPISSIYDLLNNHHIHFSSKQKNIQGFYSLILEATKNQKISVDLEERKKFIQSGMVLANFDGVIDFIPISEATYVDNPNFSQDILRKLKIAQLPSRSGNQRIENLFGITPLDYIKFRVQDNVKFNRKLNDQFTNEFNELKPHLFSFRYQKGLKKSQLNSELTALKNLKIQICFDIKVEYVLNDEVQNLELQQYEYIQDDISKVYYIKLATKNVSLQELKKDFRFKETVADIICGALKVTENRKDFMFLLGELPNNWIHLLSREFDNYAVIEEEVNKQFDGALTSEQKFWKTLFLATKVEFDTNVLADQNQIHNKLKIRLNQADFFKCARAINYHNLNDFKNISPLQKLFKDLKLDIEHFNSQGYKILSFDDYWSNRIYSYHQKFASRYASFLYKNNNSKNFTGKCNIVKEFNQFLRINTLFYDIERVHETVFSERFERLDYNLIIQTEIIDLDKVYRKNLKAFEHVIKKEKNYNNNLLQDKKYDSDFRDAIIFNNTKDLIAELQVAFSQHEKKGSETKINIGRQTVKFDKNDHSELMSKIQDEVRSMDLKLNYYDPSKLPGSHDSYSGNGNGGGGGGQSTNGKNKQYNNSDIGFIGEMFAFEVLKKEFDTVKWVSEYAIKAGYPEGKDGLGYDFVCTKGDETRFVEVKSTVTPNCVFQISKREMNVGHEKEKEYDVLMITNLLSDKIEFRHLKNIFEYKDNSTFLENSKFSVENDTYKIRFK